MMILSVLFWGVTREKIGLLQGAFCVPGRTVNQPAQTL